MAHHLIKLILQQLKQTMQSMSKREIFNYLSTWTVIAEQA